MTRRRKIWLGVALAAVALQAAVTFLVPAHGHAHLPASLAPSAAYLRTAFGDILQVVLATFAAAVMLGNAARTRGAARVFWTLFTLGMGFWLADLLLWAWYEVILRATVPTLTLGDSYLFLHLVPMVAALGAHPEGGPQSAARPRAWLDFGVLLTYWLYLYAVLVMPYQYIKPDIPSYNFNFDLIDKCGHWVLVGALLIAFSRARQPWRRLYLLFTIASLCYAVFSDVANLAVDIGAYYTGSMYDIVLIATMCFFGYAALEGRWMPQTVVDEPTSGGSLAAKAGVYWPSVSSMLVTISTPAIALYLLHLAPAMPPEVRDFRLTVTFVAMIVLFLLVILKQTILQRDLVQSLASVSQAYVDLKAVKDQLVQSEKLASMGRLLAGAAHEINNPLTAILGYSDLLGADPQSDAQARTMADKIGQQARRTKMLVEDLLKFSQESPPQRSLNDVQALVNNAIKIAGLEAGKAITVDVTAPSRPAMVLVDTGQILQVFVHLIRNAADAMRNSELRALHISMRSGNGKVQVEFADSGEGVKNPDLVFDPFYTTKSPGKGTGLGLSACYGILQKHGGQIICQNRPQGGAIFTVVLPAAEQAELQNA